MGNCFSIQFARCSDCGAGDAAYVRQLKVDLEALKAAVQELRELKSSISLRVSNEEEPGMKRLENVDQWLSRAEAKIVEADGLIRQSQEELEKLFDGSCCSKKCISHHAFGERAAMCLKDVNDLKTEGDFKEAVKRAPADPVVEMPSESVMGMETLMIARCLVCSAGHAAYVRQLEDDLEDLKTAVQELRELGNSTSWRISNDEGPGVKKLENVDGWLSRAEAKIVEADGLIRQSPEELEKLFDGSCCSKKCISSYTFGERVAMCLKDVNDLKTEGDFKEVVKRAPADPVVEMPSESVMGTETLMIARCLVCSAGHAAYVRQLEDDLEDLKTAVQELRELRNSTSWRVSNDEGPGVKKLENVDGWLSRAEAKIVEADGLIRQSPEELGKLFDGSCCSKKCISSYTFGERVAMCLKDVNDLKTEGDFKEVVKRAPADPVVEMPSESVMGMETLMITRCLDCSAGHAAYVRQLEDDLEALKTAVQELKELKKSTSWRVSSVEGPGMKRLENIDGWLSRAEAKIAQADWLIGQSPEELEKLSDGSCCSKKCISSYFFGERVAMDLKDVNDLKTEGDFKEVVEMPSESVVGMESMLEELRIYLMEEQVRIVGLYGEGGVGKTAFLTQINKFFRASSNFDVVIWAVASKNLRMEKIQEGIGKQIGFSIDDLWKMKSVDEKACDILNVLHNQRFVLLLDDVWTQVDLVKIGIPENLSGSKIIFTTRFSGICRKMNCHVAFRLNPLHGEEAWELFKKKVGEDILNVDILPLAKQAAKECRCFPLGLIVFAQSMVGKKTVAEWTNAINTLRTYFAVPSERSDLLHPILEFSFESLANAGVRSCFLFCALFPEDFKIRKDSLIEYWFYEGLCEECGDFVEAQNWGHDVIGFLTNACLLEEEKDKHGNEYVKMHHRIRDFALRIAKDKFIVQDGAQSNQIPKIESPKEIRMMSLMETSIQHLTEAPQFPELSTLFLCQNRQLCVITDDFFQSMYSLTVLDLSNTSIQELPLGISRLESLQYLNLSHTLLEQLPLELQMLVKLKCFNLEQNRLLRYIPRQVISSMSSLQDLRMCSCGVSLVPSEDNLLSYCNEHFDELQGLRHLRILNITITSVIALQNFFNIPDLQDCTRALSLKCLWRTRSLNISPLATMKDLQMLEICHIDYLEELNVDFTIKGMKIQESASVYNSAILMERSFKSLQEVMVGKSFHLQDLTWLILAPNLRVLRVTDCKEIKEIINMRKLNKVLDEVSEDDLNPFPKLEVVLLHKLPQLKSIYWRALYFECLEKMKIVDCPMLKKLPLNSNSIVGHKLVIEATEQWWNCVEWEDDATRVSFLNSFIQIS